MLKRCLTLVGLVYTLSLFNISDAAAKICFLPDSSCGTGKISSVKPNPSQCIYSSMAQAQNGISSCEKAYKQNFCFYRRCKTREEDKNVFSNYSDCQKALEDNQTCQSCGGCYKIVTNANQTPNNKTCNETEATCSAKGKAFEANGEYDSNNVACGSCKVNEICPNGYSTAYQSQKDCKTGETFSQSGTANGKVCGKCTKVIDTSCKDYTLTSAKDKNCYSCSTCPTDSSKYKCTESVKSGYQLVNGVCSKKPVETRKCFDINSKYINVDDPWECPNPNGYDYDVFETVTTDIIGTDGACYECKHLKCRDIDSDYGDNQLSCPRGYDSEIVRNYVGSDGQCYECVEQYTTINFEYYRETNDNAGDYCTDGLTGNSSTYSCSTPACYKLHESTWTGGLYAEEYSDLFDNQSFVLPFDMKIVTTYKVPYIYRGEDCRLGAPITTWDTNEPQTVTLTIPSGSKLGKNISAIVKDFAGNSAVSETHFYINGKERSKYTDTQNNIIYKFIEL